jgi:hypothetical protein
VFLFNFNVLISISTGFLHPRERGQAPELHP